MVHGDDQGLKLPPKLAPYQAVIVPIWREEEQKAAVLEAVDRVCAELSGRVRVKVDAREEYTPGWKFNEWEMRGVPLRIEIGPKDVQQQSVVLVRRDMPGKAGKSTAAMSGLAGRVESLLGEIQANMLAAATAFLNANMHRASTYDELSQIVEDGWAKAYWCGDLACQAKIKEDTKATNRCIPLDQGEAGPGLCVVCGRPAEQWSIWARAY
jgi:prolyl-tRNA synthetase